MSAAPFQPRGRDRSPARGGAFTGWPAGWESELARLRRDMPWFGFFFDGRHWWGVYGRLVIMRTSDPDLLRQQLPEAVRRARKAASDRRSNDS